MPLEMLIPLWSIEYSEKNPIKKLNLKISFNSLQHRRITYFFAILSLENKINPAHIYACKTNLIYEGLSAL